MMPCITTEAVVNPTHQPLHADLTTAPGFPGFGSATPAGRGGTVIKVTNRNNSGTGSLRSALEASGNRTVIFTVGGHFELSTFILITNPFISVYGQTAPGGGVTVGYATGHSQSVSPIVVKTDDVLIMHIRSRPQPSSVQTANLRALEIANLADPCKRVCILQCSLSWATDEVLTGWYANQGLTIAGNLIYEGMRRSTDTGGTNRAKPAIFGADPGGNVPVGLSFYWNVMAHGINRCPRLGTQDDFDLFENLTYNPQNWNIEVDNLNAGTTVKGNVEGNISIDGPGATANPIGGELDYRGDGDVDAFTSGNVRELTNGSTTAFDIKGTPTAIPRLTDADRPPLIGGTYASKKAELLAKAGAIFPRDGNDARVISEIDNKTGFYVDCVNGAVASGANAQCENSVTFIVPASANSQPDLDANAVDGVPTSFKVSCGLTAADDTTQHNDSVGYSYFERYISDTFGMR